MTLLKQLVTSSVLCCHHPNYRTNGTAVAVGREPPKARLFTVFSSNIRKCSCIFASSPVASPFSDAKKPVENRRGRYRCNRKGKGPLDVWNPIAGDS